MVLKALYCIINVLCPLILAKRTQYVRGNEIFSCANGQRYQENNCNLCECKNGELVACSRTICDGLPFYDEAKNCTVGRKWDEECNACQCAKQYGTVCTIKECKEKKPSVSKKRTVTVKRTSPKNSKPRRGTAHRLVKKRAKIIKM